MEQFANWTVAMLNSYFIELNGLYTSLQSGSHCEVNSNPIPQGC